MNDSAASETNNTISVNSDKNQFSGSRLTAAAIFAFLPIFDIFGVHNFILKQYGKGFAHIIIVVLCFVLYIITSVLYNYDSNYHNTVIITIFLGYLAVASSYIWAVVEGVQILQSKKQGVVPLRATGGQNTAQLPERVMSVEDTNYFVADKLSPETIAKIEQEKKQNRKAWSILSIIATVIPIILCIFCLIVSGGNTSENGPGAIWWLWIAYYWSLGIPLAVISIAFGIIGLKTRLRWLSIISLSLKVLMIVVIVSLLFIN